ncbi:MAG: hypothetical protein NTZ65_04855 [Candidatus Berkelbacteria bacterium]|nr:hypothetical protein [Candidatus Berkelbacteria bacterium]
MSKKAIFVTFASTILLVLLVGVLSYFVYTNQPSADSTTPPTPAKPIRPINAAQVNPPVPVVPRIAGDSIDDGIVDGLDINAEIVHWKEVNADYNLVDETAGTANLLNALDLSQTIKYWKCLETRTDKSCPYLTATLIQNDGGITLPPTPENPT